jgi:hypothetical protein
MVNVKRPFLILTLTALFLLNAAAYMPIGFAATQTLYGCDSNGGGPSSFWTIDTSTGAATLVGTSGGMGMDGCSGLRFQPGTGILFAVGTDPAAEKKALFTVSPATGIATLIADVTVAGGTGGGCTTALRGISDISFRSDGTLFAPVTINPNFVICLATINPTTAALTFIGNTGDTVSAGNGLAFDASNTLWHGGELFPSLSFIDMLDQSTGFAGLPTGLTIPSPICAGAEPDALAFNSGGILYAIMNCGSEGSGATYLATIDTSTGAVTDIGSTGINTIMDGIAFSPASAAVGGYVQPIITVQVLSSALSEGFSGYWWVLAIAAIVTLAAVLLRRRSS